MKKTRNQINNIKKVNKCGLKTRKAFSAGMNIGRRMKKPKGKKK